LIDNEVHCCKPSKWRGLCAAHAKYLNERDLLDKYGISGRELGI